jgi:putative ATPase
VAFKAAQSFVSTHGSAEVPAHLRNAPTALMKNLGHGLGYRYAHDEPNGYAAGQSYWPDAISPPGWYQPVDRGLESSIAQKLAQLRALDEAAKPDKSA